MGSSPGVDSAVFSRSATVRFPLPCLTSPSASRRAMICGYVALSSSSFASNSCRAVASFASNSACISEPISSRTQSGTSSPAISFSWCQ